MIYISIGSNLGNKTNNIDWEFNQDQVYENEFNTGVNVYHKKFGNGKIIKLDSDKALVNFENFAPKNIYIKFLKIID